MELKKINFEKFENRNKKLQSVIRYKSYKPMFYRPDVHFHSIKVYYLVQELLPIVKKTFKNFDEKRALVLALVHDDVEIIIGDFESGKRALLPEKLQQSKKDKEKKAIQKLAKKFPEKIHNYNYKELLLEIFEMKTIESQVVKYLDRFDAFGEALHELFAGNKLFTTSKTTKHGKVELPTDYYIKRFTQHKKNYPKITKLIKTNKIPFIEKYPKIDIHKIAKKSKPHTKTSLNKKTEYELYNWWLQTLLKSLNKKELKQLYEIKEK